MPTRIDQVKSELKRPTARVAGRVVGDDKAVLQDPHGGEYLLEIPKGAILSQEKDLDDAVILTLKPDTELMMSTIAPIEDMIGVLSSRIIKGMVRADTECCDCECTECSYCSGSAECSSCTSAGLGPCAILDGRGGSVFAGAESSPRTVSQRGRGHP